MSLSGLVGLRGDEYEIPRGAGIVPKYVEKVEEKVEKDNNAFKRKLTSLNRTAVHTPTRKEYDELMRLYEEGGWKRWFTKKDPNKHNSWEKYGSETCVDAGFYHVTGDEGRFGLQSKQYHLSKGWKVISIKEFYKLQRFPMKEFYKLQMMILEIKKNK